jgi:hypothetical protein
MASLMVAGTNALNQQNYRGATNEFGPAKALAVKLKDPAREKEADVGLRFARLMVSVQETSDSQQQVRLLEQAVQIWPEPAASNALVVAKARLAQQGEREQMASLMVAGTNALNQQNYRGATNEFGPAKALAVKLKDPAREKEADVGLRFARLMVSVQETSDPQQQVRLLEQAVQIWPEPVASNSLFTAKARSGQEKQVTKAVPSEIERLSERFNVLRARYDEKVQPRPIDPATGKPVELWRFDPAPEHYAELKNLQVEFTKLGAYPEREALFKQLRDIMGRSFR